MAPKNLQNCIIVRMDGQIIITEVPSVFKDYIFSVPLCSKDSFHTGS